MGFFIGGCGDAGRRGEASMQWRLRLYVPFGDVSMGFGFVARGIWHWEKRATTRVATTGGLRVGGGAGGSRAAPTRWGVVGWNRGTPPSQSSHIKETFA